MTNVLFIAACLLVTALPFAVLARRVDWCRLRKYWTIRIRQMTDAERQQYAMQAGMTAFFIWWAVAITKGW